MKQLIYLDNAATTKTRPEVVEAMLPYFTEYYGNPSSVYDFSTESKKAVNHARETIAQSLGIHIYRFYHIIITSRKKSLAHVIKVSFCSDHKYRYLVSC